MVSGAAHKILSKKKAGYKVYMLYFTIKNIGHMIPKRLEKTQ